LLGGHRNTLNLDGSYAFGYETLDGQKREEEGKVSNLSIY
jgi:hypothetical protein